MGDFVAMVTTISAATRFHDYRWDRRHRRGFRLGSARRPAELERDSPASLAAVRMSAMSAGKPSAPRTKPPVTMRFARSSTVISAPCRFIEGMFGKEQGLALPERARRALEALAEAGGLLRGVSEVARDPTKPASADDIARTRRHISELTEICEREIHAALLSCTRARRRMPNSASTTRPTLH